MNLDDGEILIGKSDVSEKIQTITNNNDIIIKSGEFNTFQCTNCKRRVHCIAGGKRDGPVEMLKDRCTSKACECKCRRCYLANNGKMRLYGLVDDTSAMEDFTHDSKRNKTDDIIDKINKDYKAAHV